MVPFCFSVAMCIVFVSDVFIYWYQRGGSLLSEALQSEADFPNSTISVPFCFTPLFCIVSSSTVLCSTVWDGFISYLITSRHARMLHIMLKSTESVWCCAISCLLTHETVQYCIVLYMCRSPQCDALCCFLEWKITISLKAMFIVEQQVLL